MIGYLTGKIISSKPTKIILDVNGVGYVINISIPTFEAVSGKDIVSLYIHTSVREDAITLFGFFSESEKEMFEILLSVNGIGPKLSQTILSGIQVNDLKNALINGDVSRIQAIPGIGKKTAERMLVELKGKVESLTGDESISADISNRSEAIAALATLGYNQKIAEKTVREIIASFPSISLEDLIKEALGRLTR